MSTPSDRGEELPTMAEEGIFRMSVCLSGQWLLVTVCFKDATFLSVLACLKPQ